MPSLKNILFSYSSSSSSSPSDSPLSNVRSPGSGRRLTRQRKLRHATKFDLGLQSIDDRSKSLPVSPNQRSRSPPNLRHWSMSAVPQPLPLPESPALAKSKDNLPAPGSGRGGSGAGCSPSSATVSDISHETIRKATDHITTKSCKVPTYHRRGFHQDNDGTSQSFRLDVPARSAPASEFSSPAVSPQRFRSVDVIHSSYSVPQEFQVYSTSEVSIFDRLAGSASHVFPKRITSSPDHSPLHSPTFQGLHHNNKWNTTRHSQISGAWPEGNSANVHPLPLPPGAPSSSHSTNVSHTTEGSSVKSQWQKGKLIGRGTYGSVYVAISRKDGAMCAMKEVDVIPYDSKSAECIKQLEQEIKVLQQLEHPNIVQYFGSEIVEDRFCIYLEYVYPGSINNYIREHCGAVTESVVRNFTRHILSGLAFLHSTNTIHRDIKGANLLVNASGVVKLADFGLAKHLTGYAIDLSLKGSPHWMAPEVLQSMMRKDPNPELAFAVDIWSVGCTVIEMLTGKPPWSEFNGVQAMFNVLNRSPAIPEMLSAEGKDFLRRCFQRNPADRPTAVMLLDHPFLRNLPDQNISGCMREAFGRRLNDTSISPGDCNKRKDLKPVSPCMSIKQEKVPSNSETRPHGTSDKILPSVSLPDLKFNSYHMNSSASNSPHHRARDYQSHLYFRSPGRETSHFLTSHFP